MTPHEALALPLMFALERSRLPVAAIDSNRVIVYVNPALCRRFGVTTAEAIGGDIFAVAPVSERARLVAYWEAWRRGEPRILRGLVPIGVRAKRPVFVLPISILDAEQRFLGVVLALIDTQALPVEQAAEERRTLLELTREIRTVASRPAESAPLDVGRLLAVELTPRESAVLRLLARGDRVANVATALRIQPVTVRNHLKSVYRKTGLGGQRALLAKLRQPARI